MRKLLGALIVWLAVGSSSAAQQRTVAPSSTANPSLTALDRGIDDESRGRPLNLSRLDADVRIAGTIAETTILAGFANPGTDIVEGRFRLALAAGSVVTGYALDVGGEMIDGVLVDQPKAKEAYSDKVRRGVDPGLAEVTRDNVFSTRVFPIFPNVGRTIRVRFVTPIDPREGFALPLNSREAIGQVALRVRATGVASAPALSGSSLDLRWTGSNGVFDAQASARDARLTGTLRVAAPAMATPVVYTGHANGERFFQLADAAADARPTRAAADRLRIYWDRSRSRLDDATESEITLIRRLADDLKPSAIDIVLFGSGAPVVRTVASARDAEGVLEAVRYRGATSFEGLSALTLPAADLCLLFSDGRATVDRRDRLRPGCLTHAVTSAGDADMAFLRQVASGSGGEALTLGDDRSAVLDRLKRRPAAIVDIRADDGSAVDYALLDGGSGWRAVGKAPASGGLTVRIAGIGDGVVARRYAAPMGETPHDGAAVLWAADRTAALAGDPAQAPVFKAMSQRYAVASPEMAFIVLETPYDYVQDDIAPPETYPKVLRANYVQAKAQHDRQQERAKVAWRSEVVRRWDGQKAWWATKFDPNAKPKVAPGSKRGRDGEWFVGVEGGIAPPPPPPVPMMAPPPVVRGESRALTDSASDQIVVTSSRVGRATTQSATAVTAISGGRLARAPSRTTIEIAPYRSDRPYLKALEAAAPADFDRVFLVQEKEFGATPAFYLDVAAWLQGKGRTAEAVEMLLSALELPTTNNETIGIVAERLLRYKQHDRAVYLYERLADAEGYRPQPKRQLAMALQARSLTRGRDLARADLDRALLLLEDVIETPPSGDYQGIELISLMDANAMLPAYRKVGGTRRPLDPRLVALLDTDLRVILEWNSGNNDLDLWVAEPTGERSYFGYPLTRAGGRLSNDMTSGYGPEEYLIRRAVPGNYAVSANIYAADRLDPNGAPVLTARLIRDFGRPTQREEVVDVELTPDERGQKLIGRLVVAKTAGPGRAGGSR